jgi:hypothetical protein
MAHQVEIRESILSDKIRIWIMVITAPVAFLLSYIGYLEYLPEAGKLNAAYHTVQLFILHAPHNEEPLPFMLEIGRWMAAVTTLLAVINIVLYVFRYQYNQFRLTRIKNHTIICGLGDIGLAMTENFIEKKRLIVVEKNQENENISIVKKMGVIVIVGNARDPQVLKKIRAKKADCLYAVTGDDFTNLTIIKNARLLFEEPMDIGYKYAFLSKQMNAVKAFLKRDKADHKLEIVANIDSLNLKNAVREENSYCGKDCLLVKNINEYYNTACKIKNSVKEEEKTGLIGHLNELKTKILQYNPTESHGGDEIFREVKYFDINELSAKYIFRKYPPNRFRNITDVSDPQIHILFIGFSQTGEELLKLCLQNCHFINFSNGGKKTKITLIDIHISLIKNKLQNKCPGIKELIELDFIQMNPHHLTHALLDLHHLTNVDIIYVSAISDRFNESYSVKAREVFGKEIPIIRFFTKDVISDAGLGTQKNIYTIDLFSLVAKDEQIRSADNDRKAKAIHNNWLKTRIEGYIKTVEAQIDTINVSKIDEPKPTLTSWQMLGEDFRDDNRTVIEHMLIKIRTTGQLMKDEDFDYPEKANVDFSFIENNENSDSKRKFILLLAEMEHRRWMATKYYYSWVYHEKRDDNKKQHHYLKKFEDLTPEIQQLDIDQIIHMKEIWEI